MLQTKAIGKTTGKKSAWGHLSLNSPECENSRHLFTPLEGAGLKCLFADNYEKFSFQGRPLLNRRQVFTYFSVTF